MIITGFQLWDLVKGLGDELLQDYYKILVTGLGDEHFRISTGFDYRILDTGLGDDLFYDYYRI